VSKVTPIVQHEAKLVFEDFLPCRIKAISEKSIRQLSATHESLDISAKEFDIMVALVDRADVSSRDIHKLTGMDKATITRALDRLSRRRLISRSKSKADSRLIEIFLTARGRKVFAEIERKSLEWERRFLKGVSARDRAKLYRILAVLDANLAATQA
jgi:DNA-binding MarR family transcriptional regulator